jgi:hypothetical protein
MNCLASKRRGFSFCGPAFVLAGACPSIAAASDLIVQGGSDVQVAYGGAVSIQLDGAPGSPALVFVDSSPGPSSLGSLSVPLGFTGSFGLLASGSTNAAGSYFATVFLPIDPGLAGATAYLAGVVVDPGAPQGLDVSNGASVTVVPPISAGEDVVAWVGTSVALDGSGAAGVDGSLDPGVSVAWQLIDRPIGSITGLANANEPFAVLTPDLPGVYVAELTSTAGGVSVTDTVRVDAFDLDLVVDPQGLILPSPLLSVGGSLDGPLAGAQLSVNGQGLTLGAGGAFGPQFTQGEAFEEYVSYEFELQLADGRSALLRRTGTVGVPQALSAGALGGLVAQIAPSGMPVVSQAGEQVLADLDVDTLLLSLPPTQIANQEGLFGFTIFSATVDFLSVDYNPTTQVELTLENGGVRGDISIFDVVATFRVTGQVLEIPYDLTGTITSSPVDASALLSLSIQGGEVQVDVSQPTIVRNNFNFDLDGFLGETAELFIIESSVKGAVEDAIQDAVQAELGPGIASIFNEFELAIDLSEVLELPLAITADFADIQQDSQRITFVLDAGAQVLAAVPGAPVLTHYSSVPQPVPALPNSSPQGLVSNGVTAFSEDALNVILAGSTVAGLLDGDLTELFDPSLLDPSGGGGGTPGGETLTASALAVLFPGAGFDRFPGDAIVELASHGTAAPLVRGTQAGPALGEIMVSGLEATFAVQAGGVPVPVLRLAIDARADLDLSIEPDSTLLAALADEQVALTVTGILPGGSLQQVQLGIDFIAGLLIPQLAAALGEIPFPSLEASGILLLPLESALVAPGFGYVGFWGGFEFVPTE